MSIPLTAYPSAAPFPEAPRADATDAGNAAIAGLSINGWVLFLTGLLVVVSGFKSWRPEVAGLALHPYLIPVALALPLVFMMRLHEFPTRVLVALGVFEGMYFFSVFNGTDVALGEAVKMGGSLVTILVCALLVRRRGDFVAGALGLSIAVALLAARGLSRDVGGGVEAVEGANKNSYSLFALPAILLASYIVLNFKTVPVFVKGMLIACCLPALIAIFMSANRSGYVGAFLVGLMQLWNRRGKGLLLVAGLAVVVAVVVVRAGTTGILDERLKQTVEGSKSDHLRREIIMACLQIGLENPLIGVSPQKIQIEIGRRLPAIFNETRVVDSHNVFAHVIAASGLICFGALLAVGYTLWTWKPRDGSKLLDKHDPVREARSLLRMFVALWVVRGLFTREVLYNPAFNVALGLAIGLCLLAETARVAYRAKNASTGSMAPSSGLAVPAVGG